MSFDISKLCETQVMLGAQAKLYDEHKSWKNLFPQSSETHAIESMDFLLNSFSDPQELREFLYNSGLKYACGADISVSTKDPYFAVGVLVVIDVLSLSVIYQDIIQLDSNLLQVPYLPGFLGLRETPIIVKLIQNLRQKRPDLCVESNGPQVILCDGNGRLHPRRCGLATHLGVSENIVAFGVAKTYLEIDGISSESIQAKLQIGVDSIQNQAENAGSRKNHVQWIMTEDNIPEKLGAIVFPYKPAKNAVYVSIGHRISLESAVLITLSLMKFRVVEPIRQADLIGREYIRMHHSQQNITNP